MSDVTVNVTNAGATGVTVANGSTVNAVVGNGGSVSVATGTVSPGNATVVSGTVQVGKVTTLAAGNSATVTNNGTAYSAVLDFGIPAGPATNVVVGSTTTLSAGSNATVTGNVSGNTVTLDFGIPTGKAGTNGTNGINGTTPSISIGTVTTGAAGSSAAVTTSNVSGGVALNFTIPRGDTGAAGSGGGSGPSLSDATPQPAGTASAGTASTASRSDHVHSVSYASLTNVPTTFAPPVASGTVLGGIKVGSGLAITDGVLSASGGSFSGTVDGGTYVGTGGNTGGGGGSPSTDPLWSSVRLLIHADGAAYAYDSSPYSWSVSSFGNAAATTTNPKFGTKSLAFDGAGDYLFITTGSTSFPFGTGNFTAEAWVYLNTLPSSGKLFSLFDSRAILDVNNPTKGFALGVDSSGAVVSSWGGTPPNGSQMYAGSLSATTWYHVTLVRDGSQMRAYVNGIMVSSSASYTDVNLDGQALYIGRNAAYSQYLEDNGLMGYWNGYIDEIRLTAAARYTGTSTTAVNFAVPTAAFPDS